MRYTHRIKIGEEELVNHYELPTCTFGDQYRDGYLYGYLADGVLLGDLIEINSEYVAYEWWIGVEESRVEEREDWWTLL